MKITYLKIAPISLAMALAFPVALVAPATPALAGDAKQCISVEGSNLVNNCDMTVEAVWCIRGVNCDGAYHHQWSIGAGRSYPHSGGPDAYVQYGACAGANTIVTYGHSNYEYHCND